MGTLPVSWQTGTDLRMSNRTYVCFDCRTTDRASADRITRNCRQCRKAAAQVHYKFRIPKRNDDKGWADLESRVREFNRVLQTTALTHLGKEKVRLEQVIGKAPGMPPFRRRMLERKLRRLGEGRGAWLRW